MFFFIPTHDYIDFPILILNTPTYGVQFPLALTNAPNSQGSIKSILNMLA
jgi:hypothetical protein